MALHRVIKLCHGFIFKVIVPVNRNHDRNRHQRSLKAAISNAVLLNAAIYFRVPVHAVEVGLKSPEEVTV